MRVPHDDVADPIGGHRQTMTTASPINPETDGDTPTLPGCPIYYLSISLERNYYYY